MIVDLSPSVVSVISLIVTSLTGVLMAWIALKQSSLTKTITTLEKNTNSLKDELVKEVRVASLAKGKAEGQAGAEKDISE